MVTLLHDTYYVVAHFHYVLSLGAVAGSFLLVYLTLQHMAGTQLNYYAAGLSGLLLVLGSNMVFFPLHYAGLTGMPRRYEAHAACYQSFQLLPYAGILLLLLAVGIAMSTVLMLRR